MKLSSRDPRLDFIRGIAVISMLVQHVGGISFLSYAFGAGAFYVSAAEVFVLLSGLVTARAAIKSKGRVGILGASRHLALRAVRLYMLTVIFTFVALPVSELLSLPWAQGLNLFDPEHLAFKILTLQQTGYVVDIPLMYALLLVTAAALMPLLFRGQSLFVGIASVGVWLVSELWPSTAQLPWPIAGNDMFPVVYWQVLFCAGLLIGYDWDAVRALARPHRGLLLWSSAAGSFALLALFLLDHRLHLISADLDSALFGKSHVGAGRLVATLVLLGFGFLLTARLWPALERRLGWLLLPMGRNSLKCYAVHVPIVYAIAVLIAYLRPGGLLASELNMAAQVLAVSVVWFSTTHALRMNFGLTTARDGLARAMRTSMAGLAMLR
jgi:hypothetical protein